MWSLERIENGMSIKFLQMRLPQGRKKAFTISYDAGVRQDQRLLDLMKKYGIRGTFNLNSGLLGRKEMAVISERMTMP